MNTAAHASDETRGLVDSLQQYHSFHVVRPVVGERVG